MLSTRFLLVVLALSFRTDARPLGITEEPDVSPASASSTTDHLVYWLRRIGWLNGKPSWRGGGARGSDINSPGSPLNDVPHFPFGLGGPVGGWAWGENEISVVVRVYLLFARCTRPPYLLLI